MKTSLRLLALVLCLASLAAGCRKRASVDRVEWAVMGTIAAVQFRGDPEDKDVGRWIQSAFLDVADEFNAFDPKSAINRLGTCTDFGRPCWDFAFRLKEETQGAFDPYWKRNGKLDFGAVAKGFAVDLAADAVCANASSGSCDILIDLGGNLKAVRGDWTVGIKDGGTFLLKEGEACATSARYYRGDHIRDARGGAVSNAAHSVTVIHPRSAMVADGLSTVLFILGEEKGGEFLRRHYPEARAIWVR